MTFAGKNYTMSRTLVLFALLTTSAISSAISAAEITLDDARKASDVGLSNPETVRTSGTFRVTRQDTNDSKPVIWAAGTFKMVYAPGKVRLDVEFETEKASVVVPAPDGSKSEPRIADLPMSRVVMLSDGEAVNKVTYSSRINPTGCQIERFSTLSQAISASQFPIQNVARPQREALDIAKLIENLGADTIELSQCEGTLVRGAYHAKNSPTTRGVFIVDTAIDNHIVSQSIFNLPKDEPVVSHRLKWGKADDVWYVQEIEVQQRYSKHPVETANVAYTNFEANIVVDANDFELSSLQIPQRTRTSDRR